MAYDFGPATDAVASLLLTGGYFERVNLHEPKSAPGNGMSAALWIQTIAPAPGASGLASTSIRLEFRLRIFQNMLMEPQDAIDPQLLAAVSWVFDVFTADLTLGGQIRDCDVLGAHGIPLSAKAGYVPVDKKMFRTIDVTLPLIINDAFDQAV